MVANLLIKGEFVIRVLMNTQETDYGKKRFV